MDALSAELEQVDPEHCWQFPAPADDVHGLSLAGSGSAREAADAALASLAASAAAVGLRCEVVGVQVTDDEGSWDFGPPPGR